MQLSMRSYKVSDNEVYSHAHLSDITLQVQGRNRCKERRSACCQPRSDECADKIRTAATCACHNLQAPKQQSNWNCGRLRNSTAKTC